ncbi:hypothetical protein [Arsukibacterium indicum]|uniref:Uncharacterized protein n=1 Tax=Arsukibacterium indicum TaxID=2848612 RepID=A0ABS6MKT9_9GAMM|nr:hypothetical protein [Arsukibacterium indicum]MBV2129340.1 hypothetical protein [Arsukibacterium indicum]
MVFGIENKHKLVSLICILLSAVFLALALQHIGANDGLTMKSVSMFAGVIAGIGFWLVPERFFPFVSEKVQGIRRQISDKLIVSAGVLAIAGFVGAVVL